MNKETMQMALNALERLVDHDKYLIAMGVLRHFVELEQAQSVIPALRQAIAEAMKQEPVIDKTAAIRIATALGWEPKRDDTPAKAVEWVGLTRDEILEARWHNKSSYKFARVLEAKLKEKNT